MLHDRVRKVEEGGRGWMTNVALAQRATLI
jgi:hypothetical protein